ncbi:TBC1 domain family member 1 isoform X1 [Neodiprion pinetum]|uniref:TBC1 domain family member 1 isoform X1 n=2 Tax=Neodiprion lecontei TaxID=441921 RepID=A0ABM3G2Y9_NEOLC|nr:TBC1 domain family member 1 isoform X1 [Neodiprion pinetum]XP_046594618.1 TBC1 domain family member 1 isoform X1 [Neodiprion lecontei]
MKLIPVDYLGFTATDRRFSGPMLPWTVSEIKKHGVSEKVNLLVASGCISAYTALKEQPLFRHPLNNTSKAQLVPSGSQDPNGGSFLYLVKGNDGLFYCHLFRAKDSETVKELFSAMKEQSSSSRLEKDREPTPQRSYSSAAALTSLGADISPSSSHFFEVLYIGKIKVSHKKVPDSFIDDALIRFRAYELEKSKSSSNNLLTECQRLQRQASVKFLPTLNVRRDSQDSSASELGSIENISSSSVLSPTNSLDVAKTLGGSVEALSPTNNNSSENDGAENTSGVKKNKNVNLPSPEMMRNRAASTGSVLTARRDSAAKGGDEYNRTMLFQVGRYDLRLISPDRKQVLLHKQLKDVASCVQGVKNPEHFGFICREAGIECYIGYVFKCQSEAVADDLVGAITQAFVATCDASRKERHPVFSCDHCPMVWYDKLCQDIDGQNDKRTQSIIVSRLGMLPEDEQEIIVTKYKGAEACNGTLGGSGNGSSLREQNQFLMMLLRAHCEAKQARHVHDTAENRSEFLNQYLSVGVGSTIFMKAKRSLTNSFDHLMKRKGSRDDFGFNPNMRDSMLQFNSPANQKEESQSPVSSVGSGLDNCPDSNRPRSLRVSPEQQLSVNTGPKSPMMDIFLKVGNSPKMSPTESEGSNRLQSSGSWRQAILNRVVTPGKDQDIKDNVTCSGVSGKNNQPVPMRKTREELRGLWKKAINQQLILIRMERENTKLKERQEEATVKRIKLEYDELSSCARELVEVWDLLVSKESRISTKCDNQMLLQAIKQGVPRGKRGEVWQFLAEQFCLKQPPIETREFPSYNVPYEVLLKQLTSQQHAILIDLGRTFPNHPYFSCALGPGQLALFNLLKAYSLLDPEVGYCQGLSFVAGVLLLHMAEDQAFFLLRHLMFRRGLRKLYLPDMAALQLHLYQLSRLLHDRLPAIYNHFDKHEVSPTLYAAPWLLTLFASQFPLGFVTRVFDLLFLESSEVIFRVAVALLEDHQDQLLCCDSFEEIMEYLKLRVPAVDKGVLERVMKRVFYPDTEMVKQLNEYRVEYQVLQEEMLSVKPQIENLEKLELLNKQLTQENVHLNEQLEIAMSNLHRLETARSIQQSSAHKLESQNRSLEVTVATLGNFIQHLADTRTDIEIPGDVRRIVAQLSIAEKRRSSMGTKLYPLKVIEDNNNKYQPMKSNSTGRESQKMLKGNSITAETPYPLKSTLSQPNLGAKLEKVSSFFANSHNHIRQQRAQIAALRGECGDSGNDENDPKTVNIDIQITDTVSSATDIIDQSGGQLLRIEPTALEKSISLPLSNAKLKLKSSKSAYELGSVKKVPTTKLEDTTGDSLTNVAGTIHPLDTCSDVNFNYGGTTKLKCIKPGRSPGQNGQGDNLGKEIPGQNAEILTR